MSPRSVVILYILLALLAVSIFGMQRKASEFARLQERTGVYLQIREIGGRQYVVATTSQGGVAITPYIPTR